MAGTGSTGPVMVQEKASAPKIDLPTEPTSAAATKTNGASAAPRNKVDDADEWENASLYEEILDDVEAFDYSIGGPDVCTAEEAKQFRARLHEVGASKFVLENITAGNVSAKKLITAFGVPHPKWLEGSTDEGYYQLLGMAISRELSKRRRIPAYNNIDHAAQLLRERKNILVITGAGISTSLGIPDFRSKNTGFYSKLQEMGFEEPEQVFDIHNFDDDPTTFYTLAGDILPDLKNWTPTHQFIRLLQDKGKLLTNYTQNIDNIESHAGISKDKLIQCHGSWATATCRKCRYQIPGEEIFADIRAQKISDCKRCIQELAVPKPGMKRKRSSNGSKKRRAAGTEDDDSDGAYDIPQPGVMKPDITFFGEQLPANFFDRFTTQDKDRADLVIVIGTSMKVAPVSEIPNVLPHNVPQIYISRDPVHHINFDINLLGDCDGIVGELCRRAGWDLRHKMLPQDEQCDVQPVPDLPATYSVQVRSSNINGAVKHDPLKSE